MCFKMELEEGIVQSSSDKLGRWREFQAIITIYLGAIAMGVTNGYSAVAIPDIKNEQTTNDTLVIPVPDATTEELSWFGKFGGF